MNEEGEEESFCQVFRWNVAGPLKDHQSKHRSEKGNEGDKEERKNRLTVLLMTLLQMLWKDGVGHSIEQEEE